MSSTKARLISFELKWRVGDDEQLAIYRELPLESLKVAIKMQDDD